MPKEKQVYVLKECPPALSVGKAVQNQGCLFVWDPKESGLNFVPASEVHRCGLKVPRGARLNASRVVEYVPQFERRRGNLSEGFQQAIWTTMPSNNGNVLSRTQVSKEKDTAKPKAKKKGIPKQGLFGKACIHKR